MRAGSTGTAFGAGRILSGGCASQTTRGAWRRGGPRFRAVVAGHQRGQLRALVRRQLGLARLDGAEPRDVQIRFDALDLTNGGLGLGHVDGLGGIGWIRPEQGGQVQEREPQVGLTPDGLSNEVQAKALEALHLRGRERKLAPVIEDHREQWPRKR
jgi:hypothetical protein